MCSAHPDIGRERGQDVVVGEGQHRSHCTSGEPWQQLQSCCLHQPITNMARHNSDSTALAASLSLQVPPLTPGRKGKNNFGKLVTPQAADVWICSSVLLLWQEKKPQTTQYFLHVYLNIWISSISLWPLVLPLDTTRKSPTSTQSGIFTYGRDPPEMAPGWTDPAPSSSP